MDENRHASFSDYGKQEYWNERYASTDGESFDWYKPYSEVR